MKSKTGNSLSKLLILIPVCVLTFFFSKKLNSSPRPTPDCENPPSVTLTPDIPQDVCIPSNFNGNPISFFDDYSWKIFIALTWPAMTGHRGVADPNKLIADPGPRVFQTYKSLGEIFHTDGSDPAGWEQYDNSNACSITPSFGNIVLASFSKFGDLGQAGLGTLVGPLPCQNNTYTRYLTLFNKTEFDAINTNKWYLRKNLPNALTFDNGSIDIKTAWIDMNNIQHPERYYTDTAIVMDPLTGICAKKLVGLVGMHIVQKTPSRPQWIWSSFEQIDNIPQKGATAPFAYNNGNGTAMPKNNPDELNPLTIPINMFNVDRLKPIHPSTQNTNAAYQSALQKKKSVWQFYQLVMTQWPLQTDPKKPIPAGQPGTPDLTFPGKGSDGTAYANITMETFDQRTINKGCMNCHNSTFNTDFLWALNDHAFPTDLPIFMFKNKPAKALRTLLQSK